MEETGPPQDFEEVTHLIKGTLYFIEVIRENTHATYVVLLSCAVFILEDVASPRLESALVFVSNLLGFGGPAQILFILGVIKLPFNEEGAHQLEKGEFMLNPSPVESVAVDSDWYYILHMTTSP